jgi:hypothetical protein
VGGVRGGGVIILGATLKTWKNGKMEKWKNVITARVSHMWTVVKNCWSQAIRKMEKWKNGLP